jgi:hypothetical protein
MRGQSKMAQCLREEAIDSGSAETLLPMSTEKVARRFLIRGANNTEASMNSKGRATQKADRRGGIRKQSKRRFGVQLKEHNNDSQMDWPTVCNVIAAVFVLLVGCYNIYHNGRLLLSAAAPNQGDVLMATFMTALAILDSVKRLARPMRILSVKAVKRMCLFARGVLST